MRHPSPFVSRLSATLAACLLPICAGDAVAAPKAKAPAPASAAAEDALPKAEDVAAQARAVFTDLDGNSDPAVRTTIFEGRIALGKDDRTAALTSGLADAHWPLRARAPRHGAFGEGQEALRRGTRRPRQAPRVE